ncbi:MAG: hypothetical protein LPK46_06385 [Bacteroidota bacterium]|nr:hypothetical protein [Bacteroidota bacterium]MDX5447885.1 hypothetical protein [Bacteroidota bacterium]MDX5505746.1 hypothetical protein [Bacteroidota bacterium]
MRRITLFLATLIPTLLSAQVKQSELSTIGEKILKGRLDSIRVEANERFTFLLEDHLTESGYWEAPLDSVSNISVLEESGVFRLLTWLVPRKGGAFDYHGFLVLEGKKGPRLIPLLDATLEIEEPEFAWLKTDRWYGAIYYDFVITRANGEKVYTLLGYRPHLSRPQEKVIDVLDLSSGPDKVRFGSKIFETPVVMDQKYRSRPYRLILRYSPRFSASVQWNEKEDMIIMDHLSPPDASMQRQWMLYGPDFSYDGLYWDDEKWHLKRELVIKSDLRTPAPADSVPQGLPQRR